MRWVAAVLLAALAVRGIAAVDADTVQAGARALREGQWALAEDQLRSALQRWPADPDLEVLLGIALYHRARSEEAARLLEHAVEHGTAYDARGLYYLALASIDLGDHERTERLFARLLARHPDSPEAEKVRQAGALTLRPPALGADAHVGELVVLALGGWDSRPDEIADSAGLGGRSDAYWLGHLGIGARFAPVRLAIAYTRLDFARDQDLDADALRFSADHAVFRGPDSLVPRYTVRELWLRRSPYETRQDLSLRWNRRWGEDLESDVAPCAVYKLHPAAYEGEDGWIAGGSAQLQRHGVAARLPRLSVGLAGESYQARSAWLGWNEASAFAGAHAALGWAVESDLELRARERVYGDVDPAYGERRRDQRGEIALTVERPLASWLVVELAGVATLNRSTIGDYDFTRFAASLALIALR